MPLTPCSKLLGLFVASAFACSSSSAGSGASDGDASVGPPVDAHAAVDVGRADAAAPSEASILLGSDGSADAAGGCALAATNYIYVGTIDNELYRFDPHALVFKDLGTMNCPGMAAQTGFTSALAIDQQGIVWVSYNTEGGVGTETAIFRVDPSTLACTKTPFKPGNQPVVYDLSFASDAPGSNEETMYLSLDGVGLGYMDAAWTIHTVPSTNDPIYSSDFDVQGTASGAVYGLQVGTDPGGTADLAQLDPKTGAVVSSKSVANVYSTSGSAFGYWGGEFWIFGVETNPTTDVQVYDPATGTVKTVLSDIGFTIDASGVSICAPTTPPAK